MPYSDESELEFMKDPNKWPLSFFLPMRQLVSHRHGFLVQLSMNPHCPPPEPVVYLGTIYEIREKGGVDKFRVIEYKSLEAVIKDGWRID